MGQMKLVSLYPTFQKEKSKAGIPPRKSDASGSIGPKYIVTLTSGFSARCRPMHPIFRVEFQLMTGLKVSFSCKTLQHLDLKTGACPLCLHPTPMRSRLKTTDLWFDPPASVCHLCRCFPTTRPVPQASW